MAARSLYQGRSFREAEKAAEAARARLAVLSAGLGLIDADMRIPAYALTVAAEAADNVLERIDPPAAPAIWWRELKRAGLGGDLATLAGEGLILIAAGRLYLEMLAADLETLPEAVLRRVRLFTGARERELPAIYGGLLMPYDERLDGPDSDRPGTRSDFAQRALHDFAVNVLPSAANASIEEHRAAILKRMAKWRLPQRSRGVSRTDPEITHAIAQNWQIAGGRSSTMLRLLRDDLGIACEQGRFRRLFNSVGEERAS